MPSIAIPLPTHVVSIPAPPPLRAQLQKFSIHHEKNMFFSLRQELAHGGSVHEVQFFGWMTVTAGDPQPDRSHEALCDVLLF